MKVLQFNIFLLAVKGSFEGYLTTIFKILNLSNISYNSFTKFLVELKSLDRRSRSFKRGAITIQNDLNQYVKVSVQAGIQNKDSYNTLNQR